MSKHKGIRFCDKCLKSIPTGDAYYEYADFKKDKCSVCNKKSSFVKLCAGAVLLALSCVGGYTTYDKLDTRVEDNTNAIVMVGEYTLELEAKVKFAFKQMGVWAGTVEHRLNSFHKTNKEEAMRLSRYLERIEKQSKGIIEAQAQLVEDLSSGKMTNKKVATAIAVLQAQVKDTEEQLQSVLRNPQEIINKVVKPTVVIAVKSTKGERARGSGVLFKREKIVNPKTKRVTYRYYGFTCYHVWQGVFKYYEDIKRPDKPPVVLPNGQIITPPKLDRKLNPTLVLYYFGGDSTHRRNAINAEFIHPTSYIKEFRPQLDFAVFTFVSHDKNIAIAELASDKEVTQAVYYGSNVYSVGIAMSNVPSLYSGTVANPQMPNDRGVSFSIYAYYGQSGGPIFDAKTLKVISINQRLHIHPTMLGGVPVTNVLFGSSLKEIRAVWKNTAPTKYKKILD